MSKVWKIVLALALLAGVTQVAYAQSPVVVIDGEVVDAAGQAAHDTVVVAFLNSHEIGRTVTQCDGGACRFELAIPDEAGIGNAGPNGIVRVHVGTLKVKTPKLLETPPNGAQRRAVYAVLALSDTPNDMPQEMKDGQLGLLPDGGVAVINPTRPPETPLPTGSAAFSISNSLAALAALAVMGAMCLISLVIAVAAVGWLVYRWRSPTPSGTDSPR